MAQTIKRKFDVQKALASGASQEQVEAFMLQNNLEPLQVIEKPPAADIGETISRAETIAPAEPSIVPSKNPVGLNTGFPIISAQGVRNAQPYISSAIGGLTSLGTAMSGYGAAASGAVGSLGASISDMILNKFLYNRPQSHYPISETLGIVPEGETPFENPYANAVAEIGENTVANEIVGAFISPAFRAGRAIGRSVGEARVSPQDPELYKISPVNLSNRLQSSVAKTRDFLTSGSPKKFTQFEELEPTYSQIKRFETENRKGKLSEWVENLFASKQKKVALEKSGFKIIEKTENLEQALSGNKKAISLVGEVGKESLDDVATRLQTRANINFDNLQSEITYRREIVETMEATEALLKAATPGTPTHATLAREVKRDAPNKLKLEKEIKELGKNYFDYFPGDVESGLSVKELLEDKVRGTKRYPTPVINQIADEVQKMKRFFNTGEINVAGKSIKSSNPRKDLKGYQYQRLLQENYDSTTGALDMNRLTQEWNKYKLTDMGKTLYSAEDRANIDEQFRIFNYMASSNKEIGASRYLTLRLATGTAALGSAVLTTLAGGSAKSSISNAATIIGGYIGLNQLGKLMTNKDTARIMIAMTRGGALGVSPVIASRMIGRALRGQQIELEVNESGSIYKIPGKIGPDGKFVSTASLDIDKDIPQYSVRQ
jgi:hypothetical protein